MSDEQPQTPEKLLQIPDTHIQRVIAHHFQKKLGKNTPTCWMCQTNNWTVSGVYALYPYMRPKHELTSIVAPVAMIRCAKCANTAFLPWLLMETAWKEENPDAE